MSDTHSSLGRLLHEISWEGNARTYRDGGRGLENVLTFEVFQALDFLPRTPFLGRIIRNAEGGCSKTLALIADHVEHLNFRFLPGNLFLSGSESINGSLCVQPDAILESPNAYCLLEAKRLRRGAFQPDQLAKEFVTVFREAKERSGVLLLVLPKRPPVPVKGHGTLSLRDAVARWLPAVLERAEGEFPPLDELVARIDSTVAFTTWAAVAESVIEARRTFADADQPIRNSIDRLSDAVLHAIHHHG